MSYPANADVGGGSYSNSTMGGGRYVPYALPIDDVLDNKVAFSMDIKEAPDLDGNADISLIKDAYQNVVQEANESESLKDEIKARLEATNSKQYFTGEEAQNQINNLKEIIDDMNALCDALNKLAAYQLGATATKYNAALKKLKDCVDMKLLKELADQINAAAKSGQSWHGGVNIREDRMIVNSSKSYTSVPTGEINNGTAYAKLDLQKTEPVYNEEGIQVDTKQYYVYTVFSYINYWAIFKLDFWPFTIGDDDLPKLVQRFNNAGIGNPYQYI